MGELVVCLDEAAGVTPAAWALMLERMRPFLKMECDVNTNTGEVYRGDEILKARDRGEPVIEVSERVAKAVTSGLAVMNRAERRRQKKASGGFGTG